MSPADPSIDAIMETASVALARMDYLACERHCLDALQRARAAGDWAGYARVLLPLQESRRQRRMIAAEGVVRLGTTDLTNPDTWLDQLDNGCIVVTHPHDATTARHLAATARQRNRFVEVLFADNPTSASRWVLRSFDGPPVSCEVDSPPVGWINRWLTPGGDGDPTMKTPADWFLDAAEALGDRSLQAVDPAAADTDRITGLEQCLRVVTDHEIIHQQLAESARRLGRT